MILNIGSVSTLLPTSKEAVATTGLKPATSLKIIPVQETVEGGGTGANLTNVNAPVTNLSKSTTTMAVATSSVNPVENKYGLKV